MVIVLIQRSLYSNGMGSRRKTVKRLAKRLATGITKTVFLAIAEATRIGVVAFSRKSFFEKDVLMEYGYLPWQVQATMRRFEKFGYLRKKSGDTLELLPRGRAQMVRYSLEDIQAPPRPMKWDGKWRILVFDIPEEKKWYRGLLREKLKEWHFAPLQRSVYVSPFDCGREFEDLLMMLNLDPYVHIVVAEALSPHLERHFISRFRLQEQFPTKHS